MVEFLLALGAPTNFPDDEPWATPLAWAVRRRYDQIAEMLKAAGTLGTLGGRTNRYCRSGV